MATTKKTESLPTQESAEKKDQSPVTEVPSKKVGLSTSEERIKVEENQNKQFTEMEVDGLTEDVISPSNQT